MKDTRHPSWHNTGNGCRAGMSPCVALRTCPLAAGPAACLPALPDNHLPLISAVKIVFMLLQYFLFPNLDGSLSHLSTKMLKHFLKTSKQEET